jgi:predicted  nucleic acid-binding Zn ribbon protein
MKIPEQATVKEINEQQKQIFGSTRGIVKKATKVLFVATFYLIFVTL